MVFICMFRRNIAGLLDRAKTVGYRGVELQADIPDQTHRDVGKAAADRLVHALDSPALKDTEKFIRELLTNLKIDEAGDKEKVLIRYLAADELLIRFMQVESSIWGSQIYILEHLNDAREGIPKEEVKAVYYDKAAEKYAEVYALYTYDNYLAYLRAFGLIIDRNGRLCISQFGVEFLQYLINRGKSGARFRAG